MHVLSPCLLRHNPRLRHRRRPFAARIPTLYQFFGPGGVLARTHPAYEFRRGQLQMAEAVEQALRRKPPPDRGSRNGNRQNAGLPAAGASLRQARHHLHRHQDPAGAALLHKDVPFLQAHLGELRVCYMKGRANYLCRKKLYDLTDQPILNGLEEINQFRIISDWDKTTETGDRAELSELPEISQLWHKLDARAERCIGAECQQFDRCFITEMRRRAAESDIIIVNHHLFFADLAIKAAADRAPDAGVLPDAGAVIFDEAHELEDVADQLTSACRSRTCAWRICCATWRSTLRRANVPLAHALAACSARARALAVLLLAHCRRATDASPSRTAPSFWKRTATSIIGLQNTLHASLLGIAGNCRASRKRSTACCAASKSCGCSWTSSWSRTERNTVFWIERRGDRRGFRARQRQQQRLPAGHAHRRLRHSAADAVRAIWKQRCLPRRRWPWAAALTTFAGASGMEHARELIVPSHFDYEARRCCTCRPICPTRASRSFVEAAVAARAAVAGNHAADAPSACSPATR